MSDHKKWFYLRNMTIVFASIVLLCMVFFPKQSESWTRIGDYVREVHESSHPYGPSDAGDEMVLWQTVICHPDASYIAVHFAKFELAGNDYVEITDPTGYYHHRYNHKGYMDSGKFWGLSVTGDTMIITLYGRGIAKRNFGVFIDTYAHGFPLITANDDSRAVCGPTDYEDALCYENTEPDAYQKSKAIVKMLKDGVDHCTGWLVSCENHLLTNQHCVANQSILDTIEFQFMYQRPQCNSGTAVYTLQTQGGTLLVNNFSLDYCLLVPTLNGNDYQDLYGFIRIDDRLPVIDERIYIPGHPSGLPKKLSVLSTHSEDQSGFCEIFSTNEEPCTGGPGDIGYYCDTSTGSSGSPVISASSHKAIALHHCGDCPNRGVPINAVFADIQNSAFPLPPCTTCDPGPAPINQNTFNVGENHVRITWSSVNDTIQYHIYRSRQSCSGPFSEIGTTTGLQFDDTTVSGGFSYYYAVTSENSCGAESVLSNCRMIIATGNCIEKPQFSGAKNAYTHHLESCAITIEWDPATTECGSELRYSIYTSTQAGFTPAPDNLLVSCLENTSFFDSRPYPGMNYYIVRAENNSPFGSGPCYGGMIDENVIEVHAYAYGISTLGNYSDTMEGSEPNGWSHSSLIGTDDWAYSTAQSYSPTHSWFSAGNISRKDVVLLMPKMNIGPGSTLGFFHSFVQETGFDGSVIEISTDNALTFVDLETLISLGGYTGSIDSGSTSPIAGQKAWTGNSNGFMYSELDLSSFNGQEAIIRFRNTSDGSSASPGWYIDDVVLTNNYFFSPCIRRVPTLSLTGLVLFIFLISIVMIRRR